MEGKAAHMRHCTGRQQSTGNVADTRKQGTPSQVVLWLTCSLRQTPSSTAFLPPCLHGTLVSFHLDTFLVVGFSLLAFYYNCLLNCMLAVPCPYPPGCTSGAMGQQ